MKNGLILVDKPKGMTSFDVIRYLRDSVNIKKMGHLGTLDPFATGLLVILTERATKMVRYIDSSKKTYEAELKFGISTDTMDITGEVVEKDEKEIELPSDLKETVLSMKTQIPPKYSAIKLNGKRAYSLARKNIEFEMKPRAIEVFDFEIISFKHPILKFEITVSKGTYIRSISSDIGKICGTIATTKSLRRTKSGIFDIKDAHKLEEINIDSIHPIDKFLKNFQKINLNERESHLIVNGGRIKTSKPNGFAFIYYEDKLISFSEVKSGIIHPKIIL